MENRGNGGSGLVQNGGAPHELGRLAFMQVEGKGGSVGVFSSKLGQMFPPENVFMVSLLKFRKATSNEARPNGLKGPVRTF